MKDFFITRFATIGNFLLGQNFVFGDLKNIFSWDYWTEAGLAPQTPYLLSSLLATIVLIALLLIWRKRLKTKNLIAPVYEGPINQLANIVVFIVIIAVSYAFFRGQEIGYLSSRLVLLASLIVVIVWSGWVAFYAQRIAPAKGREYLEKERFFRYIPKKKHA